MLGGESLSKKSAKDLFDKLETGVTIAVTPVLSLGFCRTESDARYTCGQGYISTSSDLASLGHLPLQGKA